MSLRYPPKMGICRQYRSPKVRYSKRVVAEFDCKMLHARHPEVQFDVFKCDRGCRMWHIGKPRPGNAALTL